MAGIKDCRNIHARIAPAVGRRMKAMMDQRGQSLVAFIERLIDAEWIRTQGVLDDPPAEPPRKTPMPRAGQSKGGSSMRNLDTG